MIVKAKILRGDNCGGNVKELPLEKKMKALYQMYFSCLIYLRKKVMIILQMSQREVESTQYILPAEFEINCWSSIFVPSFVIAARSYSFRMERNRRDESE